MKECFLSPLAERKLDELIHYLQQEWSEKSAASFLQELERAFERISQHPESCPVSAKRQGIRKCVVSKKTSFYYRVKEERIEVITIIDTREERKNMED